MGQIGKYSIRFDQRNATNTAYTESFVSGSNLVLATDALGVIIGTTLVPSSSYAISTSYAPPAFISGSTIPVTSSWSNNSLTSSYVTASNIVGTIASSSYALSASYAPTNITTSWAQSASNAINSQTASYLPVNIYNITSSWSNNSINSLTASSINFIPTTSSYANSASVSINSLTASYVTSSNIVGIVNSASYARTASVSINSLTASYVTSSNIIGTVNSSSYALSASYAPVNTNITSSWAQSASNAVNSQTASYLPIATYNVTSSWANSATNSITSSYVTGSQVISTSGSFSYLILNNSIAAPTSSTDNGINGEIRIDNNYLYIYSNNVWTRIPKSQWT